MSTIMKLRRDAYTVDAIVGAGIPAQVARTLVVDGPRAIPQRARESVSGRKRTKEPTTYYVWGPDADVMLRERGGR